MARRAGGVVGIWALGLCMLFGCAVEEQDPDRVVVASIDDQEVTLTELQRYLAMNLIDGIAVDPGDPAEANRVKSRLFDALLDERLLQAEAERRGLEVSDREVEAWHGFARENDEIPATRSGWEEARRHLQIQKLEEQEWRRGADAVASPGEASLDEVAPPRRRVRLRSLRLTTGEVATRVVEDIRRKRTTFDEAVVAYGTPPDGLPQDVDWSNLRPEDREVLEGLKLGQVSRPLELDGAVWLFRVEEWLEGAPQDPNPTAEAHRAAFAAMLDGLRKRARIRIRAQALPFGYVAEGADS